MAITYKDAGVDIEAGARAVALMKTAVDRTHGPEVLAGLGGFGGLFDASAFKGMQAPVLVASTDGVGTKTRIAMALGRYDTLGFDIVNHCVNDILVQGAKPLFFLDYVASSRLDPERIAALVSGAARACEAVGCALLGGETAEMPGVYVEGELDLVGTIVGVVDRGSLIDGRRDLRSGDVVLGLASSGLHTNGFSLARRVFEGWDLSTHRGALGASLGDALLAPHRCYLDAIAGLRAAEVGIPVHALVHVTGGGLVDNPPRVLPEGLAMALRWGAWPIPPLFELIQKTGGVGDLEMARTFNLGIGMLVVVPRERADEALSRLGGGEGRAWVVGEMRPRDGGGPVVFEGALRG